MSLPIITQPQFEFKIPSTNKPIKMRPMLVKEEKILLMAKQSGQRADIMNAIKQIVANCTTSNTAIDNIAIFDLEYLFVKLRAISISNKAKVSYIDKEDQKQYDFEINLDKLEIDLKKAPNNKIQLSKDVLLELSWPSAQIYTENKLYEADENDIFDLMLVDCMNKLYEGDKVYDPKTSTFEEKKQFIENIPAKSAEEIREYFKNIPNLYYKITYKNSNGTEREIELNSLDDFFTL